ncbi:hypothetical protein [Tsukamurella sp. USMM236]|uniref:hypothetical protein n=1 Tax=Tsukamurella sp. USMM236 TaxID=3081301 RepID=UPI003018AD54
MKRNYIGAAPEQAIQCLLCRSATRLSKAHIPPQCAGNRQAAVKRMRPYIQDEVMRQSSPKDGGMWLRTICQDCNNLASKYDPAYGDLARRIDVANRLAGRVVLPYGGDGTVPAISVAPGRVARSVLHGMVALAPSMSLMHDDFLASLILDDDSLRLPEGLRLSVARVDTCACRISSAYSMMRVVGARQMYDVLAEVCFYPFLWILHSTRSSHVSLGPHLADAEGWGDATEWIRYSRSAYRADMRDVLSRLPMTTHPTERDRDEWVEMLNQEHSYLLEGAIDPSKLRFTNR